MDAVTLAAANAAAAKRYAPVTAAAAGARTHLPASSNVLIQVGTAAAIVAVTERTRRTITIVNRSTGQTLFVGLGTLDSTTVPGSGFDSVPAGQEWTTTDVRPVFAYYATTADLAQVRKEVVS